MESFILITGLVLFSATTTYDLHHKTTVTANNQPKVEQTVEKGFFNQDSRK